jgi:Protein of unknown function (DUF1302)
LSSEDKFLSPKDKSFSGDFRKIKLVCLYRPGICRACRPYSATTDNSRSTILIFTPKALALSALGLAALPALAVDFKLESGIEGKFNSTITLGTQIRANDASPDAYSTQPSLVVPGTVAGKLAGQTGGSDLNYSKGSPISTVLKGVFDLDLKKDNLGIFVRGTAWRDFVQGQSSVPYGNFPNAFVPNTALSDRGFASSAQFNGAEFRDYYLYGQFGFGSGNKVDAKLGRHVLQWGGSLFTGGGINAAINPTDFSSQFRAGALPFESKLPLGMVSAKLATGTAWSLEGFLPYESRSAVLPGCGTYFDVASFAPQGCDFAGLAGASEQTRLATNNYIHRSPDAKAQDGGQFGLSASFKSESLNTEFRGYAMNTHSAMPSLRATVNAAVPGATSTNYANLYVENIALYGMSFNSKLNESTTLFGELAYRPNQPITLNAFDIVSAFVTRSPTSILALNKGILGVPVGGTFDAYDRFGVVTGSIGANKVFANALGAARVAVAGELGFSKVNGLPDPSVLRYGRPLAYNGAAYTGGAPCVDTVAGKTCTNDGYITSDSWGLRFLMSASYPGAVAGATLTPSLLVAQDISGYSYDGTFSQGRTTVRPGARLDWGNKYFLDLQYTMFSGGSYNLLVDRSYFSFVGGVRF